MHVNGGGGSDGVVHSILHSFDSHCGIKIYGPKGGGAMITPFVCHHSSRVFRLLYPV